MTTDEGTTPGVAEQTAAADGPSRSARPWLRALEEAERVFAPWQEVCDNIDRLYADLEKLRAGSTERQMQIFWANMEVLKPAIYARPPVPVVTGRFRDRKPLTRHASEILERCLVSGFDAEDINASMILARNDLAAYGRGVIWPRYEADERGERVCFDHVDRRDFVHDPARKWKEVGWTARRTYHSREEMRTRFEATSDGVWKRANYEQRKIDDRSEKSGEEKAAVWEIWHKRKRLVVWVSPGVDDVLDVAEPFLTLENFFPCPKPAYSTLEPGTLRPVPDFLYYRDQVEEINELTARISALSEALRLKGFYAGGSEDIAGAIQTAIAQQDNNAILIPVPNFASLGGAGLRDAIVWLPVDQIATVITQLVALRRQMIDDVYQITGLSDIMRGATNPNETLGAQQLKSQYGSVRIRDRQEALVRLARDVSRVAGEIMAENFQPQTLLAMSQYDEAPSAASIQQQVMQINARVMEAARNPQIVEQAKANPEVAKQALAGAQAEIAKLQQTVTIEQVVEFLRDQRMRPFLLDIETESTIQPDENAAKQRTTEFLGALAQALGQLSPMVAAQPQSAPFAGEILKFAIAPFRAGRQLEAVIDEFVEQVKQVAGSKGKDPGPEEKKAKAEAEAKAKELEIRQTEASIRAEETKGKAALAARQADADLEKTMAETEKIRAETARISAQMPTVIPTGLPL